MLGSINKIKNIINNYCMGNIINIFHSKNLKKYWLNSSKKNFSELLIYSMDKFLYSENYNYTSTLHKYFLIKHLKNIEKNGNIKNTKLFEFNNPNFHSDFNDSTIKKLITKNYKLKETYTDLFKIHPNIKIHESLKMNFINYLLYEKIKKTKFIKNIELLKDKYFIGTNKIYNLQNKVKISQEKLRSLIEYENISKLIKKKNVNILEIGSGNGRICETILSCSKKKISKYILVDIPPALTFAYDRLKKAFPKKKIFYGIEINNKKDFDKLLHEYDIILIFPSQIRFIDQKSIELCLAIDCLHEMNKPTIKYYMNFINVCSNILYFKVHEYARPPFSFNSLNVHKPKDYFIKTKWKIVFKKQSLFPSNDFECAYKLLK